MKVFVARVALVGAALAVVGALAPQAAGASTAPRSFSECVDIAVDHDADPYIARNACGSDTLVTCYRIFRKEYGRQQWALDACQVRDN